MLELMTGAGNAYNYANTPMYLSVADRIWPTLLALPIIFIQALQPKNRSLALTLLCLVVIYIWGYISIKYSYGRSIGFILIISNILLAQAIISVLQIPLFKGSRVSFLFKATLVLIFTFYVGLWLKQTTNRLLTIANSIYLGRPISSQIFYKDLLFISDFTKQDDLIMADVERSWIIPTLGGKVVATDHPLAFFPEWYNRKLVITEFFNPETSANRRKEIFETYHPNYLMVTKSDNSNWNDITQQFTMDIKGIKVFENNKYILLKF
jgi:hypothetical protein